MFEYSKNKNLHAATTMTQDRRDLGSGRKQCHTPKMCSDALLGKYVIGTKMASKWSEVSNCNMNPDILAPENRELNTPAIVVENAVWTLSIGKLFYKFRYRL